MILNRRHLLQLGRATAFVAGTPSIVRTQERGHPQGSPAQPAGPAPRIGSGKQGQITGNGAASARSGVRSYELSDQRRSEVENGAYTMPQVRRTNMILHQTLAASISSERNQDCAGSLVARRCQAIETCTERSIASGMISISAMAAIC